MDHYRRNASDWGELLPDPKLIDTLEAGRKKPVYPEAAIKKGIEELQWITTLELQLGVSTVAIRNAQKCMVALQKIRPLFLAIKEIQMTQEETLLRSMFLTVTNPEANKSIAITELIKAAQSNPKEMKSLISQNARHRNGSVFSELQNAINAISELSQYVGTRK